MSQSKFDAAWFAEYNARHTRWLAGTAASHAVNAESTGDAGLPADGVTPCTTGTVTAPPTLSLVLPFPPTVNHSTSPNGRGGKILTPEHNDYRNKVAQIVAQRGHPSVSGRVAVTIIVFPPDRRRFDIDNRIKATLDALQRAGVIADDEAVDELTITRGPVRPGGESAVTIQGMR
jgi:crossover junction endodeoxyribonuclease RusA